MNNIFNLARAEALQKLGILTNKELIDMAMDAISGGCDNENVFQLSICNVNENDEINTYFAKLKTKLGGESMTMLDALRIYAKETSAEILSGKVSPGDGAKMIWRAHLSANLPTYHDLDGFIYAASEMDDRPADKELFEEGIIKESKRVTAAR
jgi:hypothetical protein